MVNITLEQALQGKDYRMIEESQRRDSFPIWWPHKDLLTPENLAKAGFYSISKKRGDDTVRCFCCFKELANWEENDDPWKEHLNHQKDCLFAVTGKPEKYISVEQIFAILQDRDHNRKKIAKKLNFTLNHKSKILSMIQKKPE